MSVLRIFFWSGATADWAWLSLKIFHQIEPNDFWLAIDALTACGIVTLLVAESLMKAIGQWVRS